MHGEGYLYYFLIGFIYWAYNLLIRKLHTKNEHGDGWFLVPFWVFGWPICFIVLLIQYITKKKNELIKNKF